jgi:hypothetical protein
MPGVYSKKTLERMNDLAATDSAPTSDEIRRLQSELDIFQLAQKEIRLMMDADGKSHLAAADYVREMRQKLSESLAYITDLIGQRDAAITTHDQAMVRVRAMMSEDDSLDMTLEEYVVTMRQRIVDLVTQNRGYISDGAANLTMYRQIKEWMTNDSQPITDIQTYVAFLRAEIAGKAIRIRDLKIEMDNEMAIVNEINEMAALDGQADMAPGDYVQDLRSQIEIVNGEFVAKLRILDELCRESAAIRIYTDARLTIEAQLAVIRQNGDR